MVLLEQELTDKAIPLHLRLKLFHSVVTPTVLYGCGSWVMTSTREAKFKSAQFKMLRAVLGPKRIYKPNGDLETWVEWVQRATDEARTAMEIYKVPTWINEPSSRLRNWSERLGQMSTERWARRVLQWSPDGCRRHGRPCSRWSDQLGNVLLSPSGM